MCWFVILGFFAAFGVLCALWTLVGLFLPVRSSCCVTLRCLPEEELATLRRFCWLHEMGFLKIRLMVADSNLSQRQQIVIVKRYPYIEFLTEP